MIIREFTSRRGAALPLALYLMVIFGLIMAGLLMVATRSFEAMAVRGAYGQALYAAEAGLNVMLGEAAAALNSSGTPPTHITGTLGDGLGSYDVTITTTWEDVMAAGAKHNNDPSETPSWQEDRWFWVQATGRVGGAQRTINVKMVDTPWVNPWNHVYYTHTDWANLYPGSGIPGRPNYRPPYALFHGGNDVMPASPADPHGPRHGTFFPTPLWDEMRVDAIKQQSTDTNGNGEIEEDEYVYLASHSNNTAAVNDTHVYWKTGEIPADPQTYNPLFTVTFGEGGAEPEVYDGIYFVHGNVIIGAHTSVTGMIVATGSITGSGNAQRVVVTADEYSNYHPETDSPFARTPALVAKGPITFSSNDMTILGAVYSATSVTIHSSTIMGTTVTPAATFGGLGDGMGDKDYPYDIQYGFAEPIGYYNGKWSHHPIYPDYIDPDTEGYDESVFYFPGRYPMPYFLNNNGDDYSLHYDIGTWWEE